MILDNVLIYDPAHPAEFEGVHHLQIRDGKIAAVREGRFESGKENDTPAVMDGRGWTLTPSFTDSHLHLLRFGLMKNKLDLRKAESWQEVKQAISDDRSKRELAEGEWVVARGLMDNQYEDIAGLATAADLDEIEDAQPLFILHKDGHECVVNTPALQKLQQDEQLPARHDAFIEKDQDGNWTGRFKDTAVHFIKFHFREKDEEEIDRALQAAFPHLLRCGITSVHSDDLNYAGSYGKVWKAYRKLEADDRLPIRAYLHHYVFDIGDMKRFLEHTGRRSGEGTERVRVGAFKIFVDGTHRLHTAALQQPYHDHPGECGQLIYEQHELEAMVQLAERNAMQTAMHCIGDRAVRSALEAIRKAGNTMRHRIIHAQTLSDELLAEMAELQPCVEIQPGFLLDEWNQYAKWVGEKRGPYCGMVRSLQQHELPYTLSSDAPIGPVNPLMHIFAAVNRTNRQGRPEGGWIPEEKIDFAEAFKRYTAAPAYLSFREGHTGTITPGAAADFLLWKDPPAQTAPGDIGDLEVMQTWSAGRKVYDRSRDEDRPEA